MAEQGTGKTAVKATGIMKSHHNEPMPKAQLSSILKAPEDALAPALQQLESIHLGLASEQERSLTKVEEIYADMVKQNRKLLGICVALCTLLLLLIVLRFLS